ncbi:ribonuclease H-like domain-containing protein [Mycena galopus ATCC 62051]|nr:ribonuclease H-like domain-containing protein [Mycena galopus ATCC 62051]
MCNDRNLKLRQYTFSGEEWTIIEQLEEILETFIVATEKVSQAEVALVFEVIPLIDKFTSMFGQMIDNTSLHIAIRHAANTGLAALNKYYSFTDDSEIYRIGMILHPRYKTFYFLTVGWEQTWIDEALRLLRLAWTSHYKPQPARTNPTTLTVPNTSQTQTSSRRSKISFNVTIDYGQAASSAPDALEAWLTSPALPLENDPIGYHSRQREAAKTGQSPEAEAFAQMCLDYLSAPATSVDAERLFSFSGGTIMKLRNQLSEKSAHSAVMVGQWASDPDLIAVDEFESQLAEGWTRKKKRRASASAETQGSSKVIVVEDDSS